MPDVPTGTATDRLIALARDNGWTVRDNRHIGTVWFQRGPVEWAHLGTDVGRERVLSASGGVLGRIGRYWTSGRTEFRLGATKVDRGAVLAEHLAAPPYRHG